jgi:hypothetical protein
LNAITWHRAKSSEPSSSKRPHSSKPKKYIDDYNNDLDDDSGMVSGSHSSTLDKIYVWEKKLYEEIKVFFISISILHSSSVLPSLKVMNAVIDFLSNILDAAIYPIMQA